MRYIFYILFVFLSACGPQPNTEPSRVEYKITPEINGFLVEINHNGKGAITRFVPETNAHKHENYQDLPRTQEYSVRYRILPKSRNSIVSDTLINYELGFFQTVGHGLLACIGSNTKAKKSIRIIWNAPDHNWKFANSFSANQTEQNFEASCHDLREALYVGGHNFTLHKTPFGALAIAGEFKHLNISKIENALNKNMKRVENFWNAKADDYYFISIRSENTANFGGTAQFQSFQLQLSTEQQEGYVLDRLITHEYFHHWNGLKITHKPNQAPLEHLDVWWFIEGFTDYYAYLLSAPDTKSYKESFTEPKFRNIALQELKRNYETNKNYFHVPYIQGRRVALDLDKKIDRHSKGRLRLKDLMHDLLKRSQDSSFFITQENFLKAICEGNYMPCSTGERILQEYIINDKQFLDVTNPLI